LEQALLQTLYQKQDPNDPYGTASLRALASAQAPLFAALEERAEDIRRKLAPLGDPDRLPEMPAIPADFEARITAYHSEKDALQKELLARVDEVKKAGVPPIPPQPRIPFVRRSPISQTRTRPIRGPREDAGFHPDRSLENEAGSSAPSRRMQWSRSFRIP